MRQIFLKIVVLVFLIAGMVSCSKNDSSVPGQTHMRWVNVVPGMNFDLYSNSEKLYSDLAFGNSTAYASGFPDFYSLQVAKAGTSDTLVNGRMQFLSGNYYTMFILSDTSGGTVNDSKATLSILTENTVKPSVDTFKLRFFNFAPFSPAINVVMSITGRTSTSDTLRPFLTRIYNDQSYTSSYTKYNQYLAIKWNFNLYDASDTSTVRKPIKSFSYTFSSQGIYTMYLTPIVGYENTDTFDYKVLESGY